MIKPFLHIDHMPKNNQVKQARGMLHFLINNLTYHAYPVSQEQPKFPQELLIHQGKKS
jgi:hypothetical protein